MNTIISQIEKFEKSIDIEKLTDQSIEDMKDLLKEQHTEIGTLIKQVNTFTVSTDQEMLNNTFKELEKRNYLFGNAIKGLRQWLKPLKTTKSIVDEIIG